MAVLYHATQQPLFPVQLSLFPTRVCQECDPPTEKYLYDFYVCNGRIRVLCKECEGKRMHAYNEVNGERRRKKKLANYYEKKEYYNQKSREYRETHKEQAYLAWRKWTQEHPLIRAEYESNRRALKKSLTVGEVDYNRILDRDGSWCYICEGVILPDAKIDFDHVIPLTPRNKDASPGSHTEDNIKVTHHVCNRRKNNMLLEEMSSHQRRGV